MFFFVLFLFIHVSFEGNNKYAKKVLSQPWNSLTLQISLSLREKHDKIVFTLYFVLFIVCKIYFPMVLSNHSTRRD